MTPRACPFCAPDPERVFLEGELVFALWDAFPVNPGHALIVPRRHVASWFDATTDEQAEILQMISRVRSVIRSVHAPAGYNIGINVGEAAGQTVDHLHVHVMPRYPGDVPDPTGGVRHVIPSKGNYLKGRGGGAASGGPAGPAITGADPAATAGPARAAAPSPEAEAPAPPSALVRGGSTDPLLPHLLSHLDTAATVDIAAAFILDSGVRLIEEHLRDVLNRGGKVRILTGDYLGVTEPEALQRLLDLPGDFELRVYESAGVSFHPKAYILTTGEEEGAAFVGSSNISRMALRQGVEWNYRVIPARDQAGFQEIMEAFEALWSDPKARSIDTDWVQAYQARRTAPEPGKAGVSPEPMTPPAPHDIQVRALAALEETREQGNTAGLVVLATGLGKTWLSAFDSKRPEFRRILFVAHREEILGQAMRTFRRIRPMASLGFYNGQEHSPDSDILFASIQTLSRRRHLHQFDPREFDYLVLDEFHHAAARSYRRLIAYFEPKFLLGLTATPERTDGAELLTLCGNNLVFRADMAEGIRKGLLCPFDYYGVPDEVDYENIPWRSTRFDEEALTTAVATRARAENALEQLGKYGKDRTVAFCVSQRHADFMAEFFREKGLRAVAVHSGATSDPRAHSLERLEAGELDVVCSVDMFNEGVDLPHVDTILMLRPTESRILWLQQFGRGLRYLDGKTLRVIDYIGNHRIFLTKTQALFGLGKADREVAMTLDRIQAGEADLPPGCSVTYELKAQDILRSLLRSTSAGEQLEEYYRDYKEMRGARPLAYQAFFDGFNPRATRRAGQGSWLDFVQSMGDLTQQEEQVRERMGPFLEQLEVTPMTRSYKMLVLQAMLGEDAFPGSITLERLSERFGDFARRYSSLRSEVGEALDDPRKLRNLVKTNPVAAWAGGAGTGGVPYFEFQDDTFSTTFSVPANLREAAQDLVEEMVEWRLGEYLQRSPVDPGPDRFVCRVSHAGGRPMLFLPDRDKTPGLPEGWRDIWLEGEHFQANFVKVALNVVTRPGSKENVLPDILRGLFGPQAGQPGRSHAVLFEVSGDGYVMRRVDGGEEETEEWKLL